MSTSSHGGAIQTRPTPQWIILLRHLVGLGALSGLNQVLLFQRFALRDWAIEFAILVAFALLANGLWALFFTAKSRGHFLRDLLRLAWVIFFLVAVGRWITGAMPIGPTATTSPPVRVETAPVNRKIDQLRATNPEFAGLPDDAVVISIHLDYPDVPIEKVASDLGVVLSPGVLERYSKKN